MIWVISAVAGSWGICAGGAAGVRVIWSLVIWVVRRVGAVLVCDVAVAVIHPERGFGAEYSTDVAEDVDDVLQEELGRWLQSQLPPPRAAEDAEMTTIVRPRLSII